MNKFPPLLKPALWCILATMPVVGVLAYRSGDVLFAALTASWIVFALYYLRVGPGPQRGVNLIVGLSISLLMVGLALAGLVSWMRG